VCTCLRGRSVETARTGPHASPELMLDTMDRLDGGARSFPSQTAADRTPSRRAAAVILRPAVACLPGRISAPEKKCRYRTRHTQAPKRRKSGLRFFCSRRRRPPCSWCAGEPVWPVVVTIRSLRARARVIWARLARWGAAAAAGAPSRRCAARHEPQHAPTSK